MRLAAFSIGSRPVGQGAACFVVAEVGGTHEGSVDEALRLVDAAFQAGADGILFELYSTARLLVRRHPQRRSLEQRELRPEDWLRVLRGAAASGLAVLAEPLDVDSVGVAIEGGAEALLLLPEAAEDPMMRRAALVSTRPLLVGTSDETTRAAAADAGQAFAVVVGPTEAPAAVEELDLAEVGSWRERLRVAVGFLDRTDGGSGFALATPALAVAHGADLVIKGIGRERGRSSYEHPAALSPEDFHRMVEWLRLAERAEGGEVSSGMKRPRGGPARCAVAASLIPRGCVLAPDLVVFKRSDPRFGGGFAPRDLQRVIGQRAARPIQADEVIREEMLE